MKTRASTAIRKSARHGLAILALTAAAALGGTAARADIAPNAASGVSNGALANNTAARQFVADAQKAIKNGNARLAVILLKNAVNAAPRNGAIRAQLGFVLIQTGDPVSAERELRQARVDGAPDQLALPPLFQAMLLRHEEQKLLNEFPEPPPNAPLQTAVNILRARSAALQSLGNGPDAAAELDRALTLRRDVSGLVARARLAEEQNNLPLAKSLSDEALRLGPSDAEAAMLHLGILMLSGDRPGALAVANQLVEKFPDNLGLKIAKIELSIQLKQDKNISADIDTILAKSPGMPIMLYFKSLLLARANDYKGAWHIAQSLSPEFLQTQPSIAIMVSQMAIASGNVDSGAAILNAVLAKSPNMVDVRLRLAGIRLRQNSPEAALSVLQPLKDSNDPRAMALLSQAYLTLHQYSNALETLGRLSASDSNSAGIKRELALVEMQSGRSDQAIKDLLDLAAKQPTDPTVVAPLVAALGEAKRFPEALAAADRLGTDPKQRVQSLFLRGQILLLQGDGKGALAAFDGSLKLNPKYVAALYYRAGLLEIAQKYGDADRDLQTIVQIDPKNIMALVKRAEIAARQNQDAKARAFIASATAIAPQNPAPRAALVKLLVARRDLKGALAAAIDLVRVAPNYTEGLTLLGQIQLGLGQKNEAAATFRKLSAMVPQSANAQLLLANALFSGGDVTGASTALTAAAAADPSSIAVKNAQINMMLATRNLAGAIAAAQAYQAANPSLTADFLLANTLIKAKENSQAAAVLSRSMVNYPNNRTLSLLAQLAVASGDKKRAESLLSDWLKSNSNDIAVRVQYATILMQDGENANATGQFELVLGQDSKNITALNNLAWLLQKDNPKRALALASQAFKINPGAADVVDTLGWIKLQQKDVKGALELLKRAHDLRPKDGEITYHLVLAIDASGNHNSAKGLLKALLDSGVKFVDIVDALKLSEAWR